MCSTIGGPLDWLTADTTRVQAVDHSKRIMGLCEEQRTVCSCGCTHCVEHEDTQSATLHHIHTVIRLWEEEGEGKKEGRRREEEKDKTVDNIHMNLMSCPLHPIHVLTYLSWSEEERSSRKELCLHILAQLHK